MPGRSKTLALLLAVAFAAAPAAAAPLGELVDLTHPFDAATIYWPTEKGFDLQRAHYGKTPKGYFYAANRFAAAEHGGTHVDAPIHFHEARWTVDEIPLERLMGPALVVDVSSACDKDPDYRVTVADLEGFEKAHGPIGKGAMVLLRTGWSGRWPDRKAYLGTAELGPAAVAKLRFPGLHPEAATWLAERGAAAVGIDTASIDYGRSTDFASHVALFARNVPAFENLAGLERLPPTGATLIALPMKIRGGSGGPLRAVAALP